MQARRFSRGRPQDLADELVEALRVIHEEVIQRLFAVSLTLESPVPLEGADRERLHSEVVAAVQTLRELVTEHVDTSATVEPAPRPIADLIADTCARYELPIEIDLRSDTRLAPPLAQLVAHFVDETLSNVESHARPTFVRILGRERDTFLRLEIVNNGVIAESHGTGLGTRILAAHASRTGAIVRSRARPDEAWSAILLVPLV